jgi:hypothetical protein
LNRIDGAIIYNGLQATAGSRLWLRRSVIQGGVTIVSSASPGSVALDDLTTIDLGNPLGPDYGLNVFSSNNSSEASLCLQVQPDSGTLLAAGNRFTHTSIRGVPFPVIDCVAGGTLVYSPSCGSPSDVGGIAAGDTTRVDVSPCH